jgi:hypothetical protein
LVLAGWPVCVSVVAPLVRCMGGSVVGVRFCCGAFGTVYGSLYHDCCRLYHTMITILIVPYSRIS